MRIHFIKYFPAIRHRAISMLIAAVFTSFLFVAWTLPPNTDRINCTELNGDGCVCHTTIASPLVKVWVTGPDTLREGESGIYHMFLAGPPAIGGGYNIATRFGTLDILDTVSVLVDNEITQRIPLHFANVNDTVYWAFKYTAPFGKTQDTIYSCGISVNLDGIPSEVDQWAFGPKFKVRILPKLTPVELTSFTARRNGAHEARIEWETATELNNKEFFIERRAATASSVWEIAGRVSGNGTTAAAKKYSFTDKNPPQNACLYRLKQVDYDGSVNYSHEVTVASAEVGEPEFTLHANYPNPFNPATTISYQIPVAAQTALKIYDVLGKEVTTLVNEQQEPGFYSISFDASKLQSGVYLYSLHSGSYKKTLKMLLIK